MYVSLQGGGVQTVPFHVQKGHGVQAAMPHASVLTRLSVTQPTAHARAQLDGEEICVTSPALWVYLQIHTLKIFSNQYPSLTCQLELELICICELMACMEDSTTLSVFSYLWCRISKKKKDVVNGFTLHIGNKVGYKMKKSNKQKIKLTIKLRLCVLSAHRWHLCIIDSDQQ